MNLDPGPNQPQQTGSKPRPNAGAHRSPTEPSSTGSSWAYSATPSAPPSSPCSKLTTRWKTPTHPGDTLITDWHIAEKIDKPKFESGGLAVFEGEALNQNAQQLLEATGYVLATGEQAPWNPAEYIAEQGS